jgi:hypothetical protein
VGIVSIYQRSLNISEINSLYNDYKINFQNIPLISDALTTIDLTKGETVSRDEIKDLSGNGNDISTTYGSDLYYYDGETSLIFSGPMRRLFRNSNMLSGNVSMTFNIWILVNKQTGSVPPSDQRILTIGNKFHLTLVITDNDLYGLSFGIESIMGERQEGILKPDTWYNVTGTRNNLTGCAMYVDNVIIKGSSNNTVLNIDKTIRLAHHSGSGVNTDDFQIGQIGTVHIF